MRKKVLFFVDRMRTGGIQKLLLDLYKAFDKERIEIECLLLDDGESYSMEDDLRNLGCKVHKLEGVWLRKPQDFIKHRKAVKNFFRTHHDYAAVHINTGPKNYYILKCAKKYGIPVRIAHSHNGDYQTSSKLQKMIGDVCKIPLKRSANVYLACSDYAGEWLFGKKLMGQGKVCVLPNGIDTLQFAYNEEVRNKVRDEFGFGDKLVVGNIGRFANQKNHAKLIDVFAGIHRKNSNTVLLLIGVGELMDEIKAKAEKLGISESVIFTGYRTDTYELLQAMDVYLMTSFYEGYPVTGVEAQVAGLPCVFADTITKEVCLSETTKYISLEESDSVWADTALSLAGIADRNAVRQILKDKGLDIKDMADTLTKIYYGE